MTGHEPAQPSGDVAVIGIIGGEDVLAGIVRGACVAIVGLQSWLWMVICQGKGDNFLFRIRAEARASLRTNV